MIGSALYLGRWDEAALELLRRERATLAAIPTWLFSSGPVGVGSATARPERLPQPEDVADLADEIGAACDDLRRPGRPGRRRARSPDHGQRRPRR